MKTTNYTDTRDAVDTNPRASMKMTLCASVMGTSCAAADRKLRVYADCINGEGGLTVSHFDDEHICVIINGRTFVHVAWDEVEANEFYVEHAER